RFLLVQLCFCFFFFFTDTSTTSIYTLSLHYALPIFHEDRAFRRDLRRDFELQYRVNILDGDRVVDGCLNRNLGTLLHRRLFVVLRDDLGLREQLAYALGFRHGDEKVQRKIRRPMRKAEGAARCARRQEGIERSPASDAIAASCSLTADHRRRHNSRHAAAAYRRVASEKRPPARRCARKPEFRSDVLGKAARRRNHAGFDFHLLRFAVELRPQVVDYRYNRRDVTDDQGIRTIIGKDVTASAQK